MKIREELVVLLLLVITSVASFAVGAYQTAKVMAEREVALKRSLPALRRVVEPDPPHCPKCPHCRRGGMTGIPLGKAVP